TRQDQRPLRHRHRRPRRRNARRRDHRGRPGGRDERCHARHDRRRQRGGAQHDSSPELHLTVNVPFMPEAAWPGPVQMYGNFPVFWNLTVSVWLLPGARSFVFLPLSLKSWSTLPLFVTLKLTVPLGAEVFESANLNSVALTVIVVAFVAV